MADNCVSLGASLQAADPVILSHRLGGARPLMMERIKAMYNNSHGVHLALTIVSGLFAFLSLIVVVGNKDAALVGADFRQPLDAGYLWHHRWRVWH